MDNVQDIAARALNDAVRRIASDSETVGSYNAVHAGRAWAIVAMTWEGAAYCADCAYDWPTYEDTDEKSPMPVFASDEFLGDPCDGCLQAIG